MTISNANAGMAWVDSFLAQASAADAAKQKFKWPSEPPASATPQQWQDYHAEMQRVMTESQQVIQAQISSGNVSDPFAPATAHHNIPDTVDGVETGFLNARYITLEYLSRAEDLVENHPDVAAKVFDQGDSMHRFILTMIKNHDFESGMQTYQDATDQQYAAEGDKVSMSGGMSGLGNPYGLFASSPEVSQFLFGNNYVNTVEKGVQDVISQQEKIARLSASHSHAQQMASNAMYRESYNADLSPELAAQFANAWQNEEALLRGQLSTAQVQMKDILQGLRNLESRGIAGDVTETLFNALFAEHAGTDAGLQDLYGQYGVGKALPYTDYAANSGFSRQMQQIAQQSADILERYGI